MNFKGTLLGKMTLASAILEKNSSQIMNIWEERVLGQIPAAQSSSNLALRNQLPNVLEDIAEIIDRYDNIQEIEKFEQFEEIIQNSLEHGRHRATSSHYTVKQILQEYIIFHRVLTETLIKEEAYTENVGIVLKYTMETAMLNSAGSFSESLQEMREKLIGTLAHDVRNPISTAYFAFDILKVTNDKERQEKLITMGMRSLKKSLELVEGLLDAISVKAGEGIMLNFADTDIVKEIKWVANEASEIYTKEISFHTEANSMRGIFDGTAIRRVVENLVTNAMKYGTPDTPVKIQLEEVESSVIIKVHNHGKAIDIENQSDIFNFLNRGKGSHDSGLESWGMGLTLVKSVANAHGGKVDLQSTDEEGTTFTITLQKEFNEPGKVRTELNYSEN